MNTTYFLNCVAGNLFRTKTSPSMPTTYYIGLSKTEPDSGGSGVSEPASADGYARVRLSALSVPSNGIVSNTQNVEFEESTGDWGTIKYFAIFDSQSVGSGNLLMYGELKNPRKVEPATIMTIKTGDLKLSVQNPT